MKEETTTNTSTNISRAAYISQDITAQSPHLFANCDRSLIIFGMLLVFEYAVWLTNNVLLGCVLGISTEESSQAPEGSLSYLVFPIFSSTSLVRLYRCIFVSTTPSA
jgi:hypothetical protein